MSIVAISDTIALPSLVFLKSDVTLTNYYTWVFNIDYIHYIIYHIKREKKLLVVVVTLC